ncbi:MAG: chromate transporter [Eubacteriales bacterium]
MPILWNLYVTFFALGATSFGGGYSMLPVLQRVISRKRGWATEAELANYFAIGRCTPGTIAVNVATFVGLKQCGVKGALVATFGLISPCFVIITTLGKLFQSSSSEGWIAHGLNGVNICVAVLIGHSAWIVVKQAILDKPSGLLFYGVFSSMVLNYLFPSMHATLDRLSSPIGLIMLSGCLGYLILHGKRNLTDLYPVIGVIAVLEFSSIFNVVSFIEGITVVDVLEESVVVDVMETIDVKQWIDWNKLLLFPALFIEFFKVGMFAIGGGFSTIPFLQKVGTNTSWFSSWELTNMIAVSESTPGPLGINMATYVGYETAGYLGALLSTLGILAPSVLFILLIAKALEQLERNPVIEGIFYGIRPASAALIVAASLQVADVAFLKEHVVDETVVKSLSPTCVAVGLLIWGVLSHTPAKNYHPIFLYGFGGILGIVVAL